MDKNIESLIGREESKKIAGEYVKSLVENKKVSDICHETGFYRILAVKMKEGTAYPTVEQMKQIIEYYSMGNTDGLYRLSKNSPELLMRYWEIFFPECENCTKLGFIVKKKMTEKKASQEDILKSTGLYQSTLSAILNGRSPMSSDVLIKMSDFLGVSPLSILEELKNSEGYKERNEVLTTFKNRRSELNLTEDDVAKACGISKTKYRKIEAGLVMIPKRTMQKIVNLYGLDYRKTVELAIKGKISYAELYTSKTDCSVFCNEKKTDLLEGREKRLERAIAHIICYGKIEHNGVKVNSHTLITFLLLVLLGSPSWSDIGEIWYYLTNIQKGGNISRKLAGLSDGDAVSYSELFETARKRLGFSVNDIITISGVSKSCVYSSIKNNGFNDLTAMYKIHFILGIPYSYGIENYLSRLTSKQLYDIDYPILSQRSSISLDKIYDYMKNTLTWTFAGNAVSLDDIYNILKMPFVSGKQKIEKFKEITDMNILPPVYDRDSLIDIS